MNAAIGNAFTINATQTGTTYQAGVVTIATSATAIPLGSVSSPHWAYLKNLDATNYVKVRNGSSGADVIRLYPGKCAIFPFETGAVPYAIADTASCKVEYLICQL